MTIKSNHNVSHIEKTEKYTEVALERQKQNKRRVKAVPTNKQ